MAKRKDKPKRHPGPIARAIDRVVDAVSPGRSVGRERARRTLATAGWDVTDAGRRRRKRSFKTGHADRHLDAVTLGKLREICRHHDRESALLSGILNRAVDNIVGPRFSVWPATADEGWNRAAKEYIDRRMGLAADARGLTDFRGVLAMTLRSLWTDGDKLLVHAGGGLAAYEADQLATPRDRVRDKKARIVNGVEMDAAGRPTAFWLAPRSYKGWVDRADDARRVPAADAIYVANLKRCSQTRGMPELAAALGLYDRLDGYLDNESFAAEINAMLAFFITRDVGYEDATNVPGQEDDPNSGDSADKIVKMEQGSVMELRPGEGVEPFRPDRPAEAFSPYVTMVARMVGAAVGMPLELVMLDFSKTNYSSARAALLEARRSFMGWQQLLIGRICRPIYFRWIAQGIRRRHLTPIDDAFAARWFPPRWAWVDPLKEVLADEKAVAAGLGVTLTDVIEREGRTLAEYVAIRQAELEAFADAGIPTTTAVALAEIGPAEAALLGKDQNE